MDLSEREAEPYFSQPVRQITLMLVALALVGAGVYLALPRVLPVFLANPYLNGFIFVVFVIGVIACFYQVVQLIGSVRWIEGFAKGRLGAEGIKPPLLMAPLAALLGSRRAQSSISTASARSILDSVESRIEEGREITRYIVNTLIFLGLLGTFYGLATTVPALVDTIRALQPSDGEGGVDMFSRLMTGLDAQLSGMGVAFASSLLGLAGSLVVGLLELFAGHGQNRFYRELEEWLSSITRLSFAAADGDSGAEQNFMAGVLEHMSDQMESLRMLVAQSDAKRSAMDEQIGALAGSMDGLVRKMESNSLGANEGLEQSLLRVAEGQEAIAARLSSGQGGEVDSEMRMRLRSIDVQLLQLMEEISAGRQETTADLRSDLDRLIQTLQAALSSGKKG
ncbi:biopolymer transporter ExbB [Nereida sp. MMG025]|uniref:biopolymer transporter ExbB n=1 Tax=Nereida sp. MMG025 TaxID=2909981 RepID=UPI001F39A3CE|nr:biopolymer transporter ExbB [Nereida sp. MMG025]MCF6444118.1 biopolymer transporter ExbB [Nereida sp. MMG025]